MAKTRQARLVRDAQRCQPYNDGHWCFAYDPEHLPLLKELGAHDVLLGVETGVSAEQRLARLAEDGMAIAWELSHDGEVAVDVVVGKKLSSAQKGKAQWLDPQSSYLNIPSGRLRIETLNSLAFGDPPTDSGREIEVPAGHYDVILHRVNWELMDDSAEERPELPTEVLTLNPVRRGRPRHRNACLLFSEALGREGRWLREGRVEGSVFHGRSLTDEGLDSVVYLNMRGSHIEQLGLRFGMTVELQAGEVAEEMPYIGCLSLRGLPVYFGREWYESHLAGVPRLCGLGLRGGSPPWILEVEGSSIAGGLPVTVRRGEPWCAIPEAYLDDCQVADRRVKGRIIWVSANSLILNVGWRQLHEARIRYSDVLELVWEGDRRTLYLKASSKEFLDAEREAILIEARPDRVPISEALQAAWPRLSAASAAVVEAQMAGKDPAPFEKARDALNAEIKRLQSELEAAMPDPADLRSAPLIAEGMTHWDRPDAKLLWLQAFVGKQCFVDVPTGTEVVITPRSHDLQDGGRDAGTRFPDSNQGGGR